MRNGPISEEVGGIGEDIAIVGMSLKVPGAQDAAAFWRNLADGVESIERLDKEALLAAGEKPERIADPNYVPAAARLEGFDMFDPEVFGFGPKEAAILDPQHRKFLEVCWEAMEQAGHAPGSGSGTGLDRVGVFAGCGMGSYFYFNICSNPELVDDVGMFLLRHTGNDKDFMATRVSHIFNLKGPSLGIQTACSTSLVSVHYACEALRAGSCDMALAGGSTIELPHGRGYLFKENEILSPDGHCHAFDHRAQGTVFGSGAGAVALRRLSDAIADGDPIWAVIKGSAVNNDGADKAGYLAPSVDGQAAAVAGALKAAGVSAESIGYVECHGTGTYLGDPIEVAALTEAYRQSTDKTGFCRIGSVKSNIGHLDTAAGVASLIKASLALHHKAIPPSLGYEKPNPAIDFVESPFRVNAELHPWAEGEAPRRAGVNSLGVGGTNAHVILEEALVRAASEEADWPFHVLCLSGHGKSALEDNTKALAAHLRAHPEEPLADVAWTLKEGRQGFDDRRVVVVETHEEAAELLESGGPTRVFTHRKLSGAPDVAFMLPGGGAIYPGAARDLYETEPVFAEWMDRGLTHLQAKLDYEIRALWLPEADAAAEAAERLKQPSVQLPLIMILEYALGKLWMSWGITPAAMIGHSMGENTAAALAGVLRFEDCIDLVLLRGRLFDTVAPGGMLSVPLPETELTGFLSHDLEIASLNAPGLCVVTGPQAALDALEATLAAREIDCQRINIDIAAHSRMLDPILPEFRAFLATLELNAPEIPFVSNRTGTWITPAQATSPDYWVEQLRHTVLFGDGIATLAETPNRIFLEVGPGRAMTSLAQLADRIQPNQVLSSLRHEKDEIADDKYLLSVIGRFWALGLEADWNQIWGEARRNRVVLPTYTFQSRRFFIEPGEMRQVEAEGLPARSDDLSAWGYRPEWRPRYADCPPARLESLGQESPQNWLIFTDEGGALDSVAQRLAQAGHRVTTVRAGDSFAQVGAEAYQIAPEMGEAGYETLFQTLAAEGRLPERIAHGWLLTEAESFRPGSDFFTRNMEQGFYSLLHLANAIEAVDRPAQIHLTVFTNGAEQVRREALPYPEKATIAGPCGTIPKELPGLTVASVDIELPRIAEPVRKGWFAAVSTQSAPDTPDTLTDTLLEELLAEPANTQAAYRGGKRFEKTWAAMPLPAPESATLFRDGGTYMITGGAGGIGLAVARDLAARHKANLVLLMRHPLPPREAWASYAETARSTGEVAARIAAIREIEALGGRVHVEAADVCDIEQMRDVLARAHKTFGAIHGVIHAAGVIDDAPLLGKSPTDIERVFDPKIHGLRVLDTLFAENPLELMLLFSSTSTITRPDGQIDYIAANEYLNAYAKARSGGKTRVLALNWGVWAEVGMAARALDAPEAKAMPDWEETSQPLLTEAAAQAGGWGGRLSLSTSDWIVDEHRTKAGTAILPGTGYLELAAQTHLASGGTLPMQMEDLLFLRPVGVEEDTPLELQTKLEPSAGGERFELRSGCRLQGRAGMVLNAEARLSPAADTPAPLDLAAIAKRCTADAAGMSTQGFISPQEAHLAFGPRWRVVREARIGTGEGLARLVLPEAFTADLAEGYLLHPALMDLATGWAIDLVASYAPTHLWVPVAYERLTLHAPLPAEVISWMRLSDETDAEAGLASFDIALAAPDGTVLVEIEGFRMQRLAEGATLGVPPVSEADDIAFADAPPAPVSPASTQMSRMVAMGIRPEEGVQALRRALATEASQVAVSPLDLQRLIALAEPRDERSASGQTFERPELESDYAPPETPLQESLAEIWEGLLGVDQIGIHDSFFDLGGHSLLAVRLFAAIKRKHGTSFPISVLLEAPTIAALAGLVARHGGGTDDAAVEGQPSEATGAEPRRYAVRLNAVESPEPPLFIVAGMFGNILNLRQLALQITDRPVFGLQARGLIGDDAPHETITEAAEDYLAEIRAIQTEGPYLLAGFSGGGITAYEMAQQLTSQGSEVARLILLDTPLPVRPSLSRHDRALIKLQDLRRKGPRFLFEWAARRWAWQRDKRQRAEAGGMGQEAQGAFNNQQIELAFRRAVASYALAPCHAPVTLFRPPLDRQWKVSGGNWVSAEREYVFDDNQWSPWIANLDVIEVPGDHDSMVLMPNVRVLAKHVAGLLGAQVPKAACSAPVAQSENKLAAE